MARPKTTKSSSSSTANLGFEAKLWLTAASEGEKTHRSIIYDPVCRPGSKRSDNDHSWRYLVPRVAA